MFDREGLFGLFSGSPDTTPRKVGTKNTARKLVYGVVLLATFSGAGIAVPAAFGHGHGGGSGQHLRQGPPWGRGPNGEGPPGQLRKQANGPGQGAGNGGPGNGQGNGPSPAPPSGIAQPAALPGPPGLTGQNPGHGGGGPPGQSGANPGHGGVPPGQSGANPGHGGGGPPGHAANGGTRGPRAGGGGAGGHGHNGRAVPAPTPVATVSSAPPVATVSSAPPPAPAPPPAAPPPAPSRSQARPAGKRQNAHRSAGSGSQRPNGATPTASSPTTAGTAPLGLRSGAGSGPLSTNLSSSGTGSEETPEVAGTLAPGTSSLEPGSASGHAERTTTAAARTHGSRNSGAASSLFSPAGTVIQHFINVIPIGVWIALAAALGLAALAGVAALRSGRRFRIQAGEVAAVTAAALTDPLTGVLNRRGFLEAAERELGRARRYNHPLALAFVDIRGLKAVNDSEGHLAGDRLLRRVTLLLRDSARTHDLVGRIGGDELAVLLAEQSVAGAAAMTQRVRAQVPAARADLRLATQWDVTIGTASFPEDGDTFEQLLAAADRRLYEQRGIRLT